MRLLVLLYAIVSYFVFFGIFLYFGAFVADVFVPKSISVPAEYSENALLINIGLLIMWGVQHSVMARGWFKEMVSSVVPHHVERATYVLVSALTLAVFMFFWQPMEGIIWQVENELAQQVVWVLFGLGWVLVLVATFLTDHFDLFGLRQGWLHFVKKTYTPVVFTKSVFYHWIRHPMMLGILIAFWSVPMMTLGHLVFSLGMTVYVVIGMYFEEKGLARELGETYTSYQKETKKIIPKVY